MIEIVDYHPFKAKGDKVSYLKGFLRLRIKTDFGMLECKDLQVYSKNGQHWVNFPSRVIESPEGKKYIYYMHFEKENQEKFNKSVFDALRTWKKPEQGSGTANVSISAHNANKQPLQPKQVVSMSPAMPMMEDLPDGLPF